MENYLIIGIGGFLGACARYWVASWVAQRWGASFPFGTLLINVTGSFVLGLFMSATTGHLPVDARVRLLFAIGFIGAYTTFSTYTYESVQLLLAGNWLLGLTNLVASNVLGFGASALGITLGSRL